MFVAGTIFGIFIGANVGIIMAGLLISAKHGSKTQRAGSKKIIQRKVIEQNEYAGSHQSVFSK